AHTAVRVNSDGLGTRRNTHRRDIGLAIKPADDVAVTGSRRKKSREHGGKREATHGGVWGEGWIDVSVERSRQRVPIKNVAVTGYRVPVAGNRLRTSLANLN